MRSLRLVLVSALTATLVVMGIDAAQAASPYAVSAAVSSTTTEINKTVVISGTVSPNAKGKTVAIQRRYGATGAWVTVANPKLSSTSKYTATIKLTSAGPTTFRVYKAKSSTRAAGYSTNKPISVFRWRYLTTLPYAPGGSGQPGDWFMNGNKFVNSISYTISDNPRWDVVAARCTKLRTFVGIDADSPDGTTGSTQLLMPISEYPFSITLSQDDGLAKNKNPRYVQVNFPVGPTILQAAGGTSTPNPGTTFLTLGSPLVYCNS